MRCRAFGTHRVALLLSLALHLAKAQTDRLYRCGARRCSGCGSRGTVVARTPCYARVLPGIGRDVYEAKTFTERDFRHFELLFGIVGFRFDSRWRYQETPDFAGVFDCQRRCVARLWHGLRGLGRDSRLRDGTRYRLSEERIDTSRCVLVETLNRVQINA